MRKNEMIKMTQEMLKWDNWSHLLYKDRNNKFAYLYSFYEPVLNSPYASSICIIDDTACTNFFGYDLFIIICVDENYKDQVICFALMKKKTIKRISHFLKELKKRIRNISIFLTDRNKAQLESLKNIWPESKIIYCAIHIGRNIKSEVGEDMFQSYIQIRNEHISEEDLLTKLRIYIIENKNNKCAKGVGLLTTLLKEIDNWLPSEIDEYEHCDTDMTNRVDGFFGDLKTRTDHTQLTFEMLLRSIFIAAKILHWILQNNLK